MSRRDRPRPDPWRCPTCGASTAVEFCAAVTPTGAYYYCAPACRTEHLAGLERTYT